MNSDIAVEIHDLRKKFRIFHERNQYLKASLLRGRRAQYEEFWALDGVSFDIRRGESFGIIGSNGSGKSTMLKCIAKILRPDGGRIAVHGSMSALLELGAGFHPELSGRENIFLNGAILGLNRKEILAKLDDIVEFAGLERFIDTPVKNYSSGMYVRLGFAVAIHVDPEILVIDEVLAVGDENFIRKCTEKIASFREDGRTIVLVTHGLGQVRTLCDRAAWISAGKLEMLGDAPAVVDAYTGQSQPDRVETESEGVRWGSGEIRITKIELLDELGTPRGYCRTGQSATFRLHYDAESHVDDPLFGFAIFHIGGAQITGPNSGEAGLSTGRLHGTGRVDITFANIALLEGTYDVSAGVTDRTLFHTYDLWQKPFRFDVLRGRPYEQHGFVTLRPAWRLEDAP